MDKGLIKIKLTRRRLEYLYRVYASLEDGLECEDGHDYLLKEHALELTRKLDKLMQQDQQKNTLKFCGSEALAFCLLWKDASMNDDQFAAIIIGDIVAAIDKRRKSSQRLLT